MKGVIPTHVLLHMAKLLQEEFGGLRLEEQFDLLAATSTGSLISGMILLGAHRQLCSGGRLRALAEAVHKRSPQLINVLVQAGASARRARRTSR